MNAIRRLLVTLFVVAGLAALGWYGWRTWDANRGVQTTDDAYVRGEITVVSPRVAGYAVKIMADDNDLVKAKQTLVQIDPRDYRAAVIRAQASLGQAEAQLKEAVAKVALQRSQIRVAQAAVTSAEAQARNASINLDRARRLLATGSGTQQTFDNSNAADIAAQSTLTQARNQLDYQQQQLGVLAADVTVAEAQVASAKAALQTSQLQLEDTAAWAPIEGTVANRLTRTGEYVNVGTRMLSIVPRDGLWVEANFRETQLANMKPDQPAAIAVDTFGGKVVCGYVETLGPASGSEFSLVPPDNATGNFTKIVRRFPVRIRTNAGEPNAGLLRPGMSTRVSVAETGDTVNGCRFDPAKDRRPRSLTRLPSYTGSDQAPPGGERPEAPTR